MYVSISLLRNVEGGDPPLTPVRSKEVWLLPFFLDRFRSSLRMYQHKGGNNLGRYDQMFLQPPKPILPVG